MVLDMSMMQISIQEMILVLMLENYQELEDSK
jgi:hypothetical protein